MEVERHEKQVFFQSHCYKNKTLLQKQEKTRKIICYNLLRIRTCHDLLLSVVYTAQHRKNGNQST